jgi:hypothetical protein
LTQAANSARKGEIASVAGIAIIKSKARWLVDERRGSEFVEVVETIIRYGVRDQGPGASGLL